MAIRTTKSPENATLITHGGTFHADEVFGTVILSKIFREANVLRTFKVPEGLDNDVIIYDIGGGRFDHHQRGGNGQRENGVPYSSVGLLWKEFGYYIVKNTCNNPYLVWSLIDRDLIQGIDAQDNGVMPKTDYPTSPMTVSNTISSFNPTWDSNENVDEAFKKAVDFATVIFDNVLTNAIAKAKAQEIVEEAIENAEDGIMILDRFVPWQEFVFSSTNPKAKKIMFAVFPSNRGGFNWQCVPDKLNSFGQRKAVPSEWKGLNGEALQSITGISTASFCHPAGFIGGADTLTDAIALAKLAVKSD